MLDDIPQNLEFARNDCEALNENPVVHRGPSILGAIPTIINSAETGTNVFVETCRAHCSMVPNCTVAGINKIQKQDAGLFDSLTELALGTDFTCSCLLNAN